MKDLDLFSRRLIVAGAVITVIVLSVSLFVLSIGKAFAAPIPEESSSPKYMMAYQMLEGATTYKYSVLVWNTQTGQAQEYAFDFDTRKMVPTALTIPANPSLGGN